MKKLKMQYSKLVTIFVALVCISNVHADLIPGVGNICQLNGEFKVENGRATDTTKYFAYGVSISTLKSLLSDQMANSSQNSSVVIKVLHDIKSSPTQKNFEKSCRANGGTVSFEWDGTGSGGRSFPICIWYDTETFNQDLALGYGFANSLLDGAHYLPPKDTSNVIFSEEMTYAYMMIAPNVRKWEQLPSPRSVCPVINYETFNNLKNKL